LNRISRFATIAAIAVLAFLAYQKFFPREETKIRKLLKNVTDTISFEANEGNLSKIAALSKLGGYFSPDVVLAVHTPAGRVQEIQGRDELLEHAKAVRFTLASAKFEFVDDTVTVDPSKETATVELTAKATIPTEKDFFVQELKLGLKKLDGQWRISRVETVRVFRR
jgi:hypothetical protein